MRLVAEREQDRDRPVHCGRYAGRAAQEERVDDRVRGEEPHDDGHRPEHSFTASGTATRPMARPPHPAEAGRCRKTAWASTAGAEGHRDMANTGAAAGP